MKIRLTSLILSAAALAFGAWPAAADTLLVCNAGNDCPAGFDPAGNANHFATLAAAVAAANVDGNDTILLWPGTYNEAVRITASNVTVRGMDRYGVILDGDGAGGGTGITSGLDEGSTLVSNVTFENMSGRGYPSQPFFWVNTVGWAGRWLTAYDNGGYGVYAFASTGDANQPSEMRYSYASGNADSGFYIGGCLPCNAVIDTVWAENNALGYSGTNAGGNLVLQNSEWNDNLTGILPNTLPSEPAGPQRGAVIRSNVVHDNNNASAPTTGLTGLAPLGTGIGVAGGWLNQIYGNWIYDHKHYGVALTWLETPAMHNQIFSNTLWKNEFDLTDVGPGSVNNCFSKNVRREGGTGEAQEPTSDPPMLQMLNSCDNPAQVAQSLNPMFALNVVGVTEPRTPGDPPPPSPTTPSTLATRSDTDAHNAAIRTQALACMPDPCAGITDAVFCPAGEPATGAQSPECAGS